MKASCSMILYRASACALCFFAASAEGSGFRLTDMSIAGLGTANTLVANADEPGALPYNPAALSFHEGSHVIAGLVVIDNAVSVTPAGGTGEVESTHDHPAYLPMFSLAHRIGPSLGLGLNVNAPFGLTTEWPVNTFPLLSSPATRAAHPTKSSLQLINVNPNVSHKIGANTSAALGVDYYWIKEVQFNSQAGTIEGDGADVGWNAALLHVAGPWGFGVSYRSAVTVGVDGDMTTSLFSSKVSADVKLPWVLQVGMRYRVASQLAVEFDFERTGWKRFNTIVINGAPGGPITNINDWDNANAYHLSAIYDVNATTQLRAGYIRDLTGQSDAHFTARISDADRHVFCIGMKHAFRSGWAVEGAYGYVQFDDRNYASNVPFGTYGADPSGTDAYNGMYQSHAHVLGLGVAKKF